MTNEQASFYRLIRFPSRDRIMVQTAKTQELISKETSIAVQSAFHALDQAILIHNAWTLEDLVPLQGMVCEMIRPMLKAWLDDKLPAVVERLVLTEIERRHRESRIRV